MHEEFFLVKISNPVITYPMCNVLLLGMYVWLLCSCRYTSAVKENKGADMGTAQGGLGSSPCVSPERQLRALNNLNMNSLPGNVSVSCNDRKTGMLQRKGKDCSLISEDLA